MRVKSFFWAVLIFLLGGAFAFYADKKSDDHEFYSNNLKFYDDSGSASLQRKAILGDVSSSELLSDIYEDCLVGKKVPPGFNEKKCANNLRYWQEVDAENGGKYGSASLAIRFMHSGNCLDIARGLYWSGRVRVLGGGARYEAEAKAIYAARCSGSQP